MRTVKNLALMAEHRAGGLLGVCEVLSELAAAGLVVRPEHLYWIARLLGDGLGELKDIAHEIRDAVEAPQKRRRQATRKADATAGREGRSAEPILLR